MTFTENGIRALDGVDAVFRSGEVHAVLGENGAGKTTLVRILSGLLKPDEGSVELEGRNLPFGNLAWKSGVALIQQHPPFSPELALWEHAVLGLEGLAGWLRLPKNKTVRRLEAFSRTRGWDLPWTKSCRELGALTIQKATILAFLLRPLKVLILDEPTSSQAPSEAAGLLDLMRELAEGAPNRRPVAVLFITHKLDEVMKVAHRITVLRSGRVVATLEPSSTTETELRRLIFPPSETPQAEPFLGAFRTDREPVLQARNLGLFRDNRAELSSFDLDLRPGEIVGLAGLRGEGLEALEDVLSGLEEATGSLRIRGESVGPSVAALRARGLAYVPSDRLGRGTSATTSVVGNLIPYRLKDVSSGLSLVRRRMRTFFADLQRRFGFLAHPDQRLGTLSGGNVQKVILARELEKTPCVLLLAEPAWGLDWSARRDLYRTLREAAAKGTGVLVLSSEIGDLKEICSRIGVVRGGRLVALRETGQWSLEDIGKALLGDLLEP